MAVLAPASSEAPPPARQRGRNLRRLLALAVVLVAAVPMTLAPARVALAIDGETVHVRAYADTVAELLDEQGVVLGPKDVVVPDGDQAVEDGMSVEVLRAAPVQLYVQGTPVLVDVAPRTVADVLAVAKLSHVAPEHVTPAPDTPWVDGTVVRITVPLRVSVTADGETTEVSLPPGIVADALWTAGVTLGEHDVVHPPRSARLGEGMAVTVTRIAVDEVVEEVALPFDEVRVETDDLYVGDTEVADPGEEGLRLDVYRVTVEDGVEVARELVRSELVSEPRDRVLRVGTRARPVAPAVPADSVWDRLARCESGGRWDYDGTYDGGLQFHPDTWNRWKPAGYPAYAWQATREQQIEVGKRLQAARGWWPWPHCARELGLL